MVDGYVGGVTASELLEWRGVVWPAVASGGSLPAESGCWSGFGSGLMWSGSGAGIDPKRFAAGARDVVPEHRACEQLHEAGRGVRMTRAPAFDGIDRHEWSKCGARHCVKRA
jgi:hypothetical protein